MNASAKIYPRNELYGPKYPLTKWPIKTTFSQKIISESIASGFGGGALLRFQENAYQITITFNHFERSSRCLYFF